jgi:hypothetical protein
MTDEPDLDFLSNDADDRIRAELIRQARTVGVKVAYETALAICRDPESPAQARASAIRSLLEVGDLLNAKGRETATNKDPAAMTSDEISEHLAILRSRLPAREVPAVAIRARSKVKRGSAFD